MWKFLHDDDHNDNAKAIAIPRVFSENSRVTNVGNKHFLPQCFLPYQGQKLY